MYNTQLGCFWAKITENIGARLTKVFFIGRFVAWFGSWAATNPPPSCCRVQHSAIFILKLGTDLCSRTQTLFSQHLREIILISDFHAGLAQGQDVGSENVTCDLLVVHDNM